MAEKYRASEDLIIRMMKGNFVLTNVFSRAHFQASPKVLELLSMLGDAPRGLDEIEALIGKDLGKYSFLSRTCFSLGKGLVCNPDNLSESEEGKEVAFNTVKDLVDFMSGNLLIYSDRGAYSDHFRLKNSLLDKRRLGNFHQQISSFALLDLKKSIDDWWVDQKFLDDRSGIRDTAYKYVQENFIREYFTGEKTQGKTFLDIGCGIGYYDKIIAGNGAKVLGIDPNGKYIEWAKKNFSSPSLEFRQVDITADGLRSVKKGSFDAVLISDSLLFYFVAPDPKHPPKDVVEFLKEVKDVLKPDGSLYLIEPHGIFFLQSWYGAPDRPYTVMTEYNDRFFRVVPTLGELASAISKSGFLIKEIIEPAVSKDAAKHDLKAFNFCSKFPIWWFFHLIKDK